MTTQRTPGPPPPRKQPDWFVAEQRARAVADKDRIAIAERTLWYRRGNPDEMGF